MVETDNLLKRVNTGIYGYDEMLNGGFFKQTVNVISGESGTGKTVLGSQFIYQAAQNGEKALCIMTTESANCLLYTSPSPRDVEESRMPSSA